MAARHRLRLEQLCIGHGRRYEFGFGAIYLVANDKRGLSALQLSKKLEVSYYVAWTMLHKIRRAMKERDSAYELRGVIEMDDSFFGSGVGGDKRGRGTKKRHRSLSKPRRMGLP